MTLLGRREIEELDVGCDIEREALIACGPKVAAQNLPRVAFERCAIEVVYVAEDARFDRLSVAPRQYLERVRVGHGQNVGLLHAAEAIDGGTVERHAVFESVLEFGRTDRETLQIAEHVGEPQAN